MKLVLTTATAVMFVGTVLSANAADFPKTGSAEYDTYYVFETVATIDTEVGTGGIDNFTGITRNVTGDGPFNNMSVHCLMHWTLINDSFDGSGSCTETDEDGDTIFTTF